MMQQAQHIILVFGDDIEKYFRHERRARIPPFSATTINRDKVIQEALSMVLIAALSCRTRDSTKDPKDTQDRPFLCRRLGTLGIYQLYE